MQDFCDIAVIPVEGDIDVETVPALRRQINQRIDAGCKRIILNLAQTQFIDSAGMALILSSIRSIRRAGGLLSLTQVHRQAYTALCRMRAVDFAPVSRADVPKRVPAIDPRTEPIWRRVLRCDGCSLAESRERVKELFQRTPLTPDESFDLVLATGEALGNASDHARSPLTLTTVCYYPDRVMVEVNDSGQGYTLLEHEEPHTSTGCTLERGRGIKLMRMLTDEVRISLKSGGAGTSVTLTKMLSNML